jgi:hypothetical protein
MQFFLLSKKMTTINFLCAKDTKFPSSAKDISWTGGVTQVVECLPSKCEDLSSNCSTSKKITNDISYCLRIALTEEQLLHNLTQFKK